MADYSFTEGFNKWIKMGTGSNSDNWDKSRIIIYPFDKYELKIRLGPANEFLEIIEIKLSESFLSYNQKVANLKYHDVDDFYKDE